MDDDDHYATLGVSPGARPQVIRAAYVALSKLHHPDGGTEPDHRRMQDINRAWHVLRDPARRAAYDDARRARRRPPTSQGRGPAPGAAAAGREGWGEAADGGAGPARRHPGRAAPTGDASTGDTAGGTATDDIAGNAAAGQPAAEGRMRGGRGWGRSRRRSFVGDDDTVPGDAAGTAGAGRARRNEDRQRPGARPGAGPGPRTGARRRRPGEDDTNPGTGWDGEPFTPPRGVPLVDDEPDDVEERHAGPGTAGWGEDVDPDLDDEDDEDDDLDYGDGRDPTAVTARRVVAFVLDLLAVAVLAYGVYLLLVVLAYDEVSATDAAGARDVCRYVAKTTLDCRPLGDTAYFTDQAWPIVAAVAVPVLLVHVVLQGRTGATPGKALVGLRTVREDGTPPGYGRALVRTVLLVLVDTAVWCVPVVGLTQVRTNVGHRRMGDRFARTYVVGLRSAGRPIVVPDPPPPEPRVPGP